MKSAAQLLQRSFRTASRLLRRTPLRRSVFLGRLHSWLFQQLDADDLVTVGGLSLEVDKRDRNIRKRLKLYGDYESFYQEILLGLVAPGDEVLDVGANIGLHAIPLARRVGPAGRVYAFEPDPTNFRILVRNLQRNHCLNVLPVQLALGDQPGTVPLYQSCTNRGGLSLCEQNVEDRDVTSVVQVPVQRADDVLGGRLRRLALVKVDVEGAEPLVVSGMERILREHPQAAIAFEFFPRYVGNFGVDAGAFLASMEARGRRFRLVDEEARTLRPATSASILSTCAAHDRVMNVLATVG